MLIQHASNARSVLNKETMKGNDDPPAGCYAAQISAAGGEYLHQIRLVCQPSCHNRDVIYQQGSQAVSRMRQQSLYQERGRAAWAVFLHASLGAPLQRCTIAFRGVIHFATSRHLHIHGFDNTINVPAAMFLRHSSTQNAFHSSELEGPQNWLPMLF